jgi:Transcriptional regulators
MKNLEAYGISKANKRNYESILYMLALIHNSLEKKFGDYFAACGTSMPKYNILMAVAYVNGGAGLNQKEIGEHLIASPSNVTKLVESLNRDGLISRVQNKSSRRENVIKITAKGQKFIDKHWDEYDKMASGAVGIFSGVEQKKLIELLGKWFVSLEDSKA